MKKGTVHFTLSDDAGKMWKGQFNTTKGKKWFLAWCHDENEVSNLICISYREILVV